jgi:hypothetical protein
MTMTSMNTIAMGAEIAYRQDKVRADYQRVARGHRDGLTRSSTWLRRRHHATDAPKAADDLA